MGRRRRRREVVHHLRGERVLVDLHRARRGDVVRGGGGRRSSRAARTRTGRLGTRSRASGLLCRADQRRAVGGPQGACELDVVRARSRLLLLLAPRRTRLRSAGGTRLVAGRGLGREVPEGLPEDLEAGLDEGEGVGLHCGDAGVDVSLVLDKERLEVCLVDPGRALRWVSRHGVVSAGSGKLKGRGTRAYRHVPASAEAIGRGGRRCGPPSRTEPFESVVVSGCSADAAGSGSLTSQVASPSRTRRRRRRLRQPSTGTISRDPAQRQDGARGPSR